MKASRISRYIIAFIVLVTTQSTCMSRAKFAKTVHLSPVLGARGKIILLPGISNQNRELRPLADALKAKRPDVAVDAIRWGPPLQLLDNLTDIDANRAVAQQLADEIAAYRRDNPGSFFEIVGFSGGGGLAALIVDALPEGVMIDRLVLVAAAISPEFPVGARLAPHVREVIVNFYSPLDQTVNVGTTLFGTIDRVHTASAGHTGFDIDDPKLVQVRWEPEMIWSGHLGSHVYYQSEAWQRKYLLPWVDPAAPISIMVAAWHKEQTCGSEDADAGEVSGKR